MRIPARFTRPTRHQAMWRRLEIVGVALIGAWLGVLAWGQVTADVGPVETDLSVAPSWHGDSNLDIAPLGSLSIDSHDGPARLDVSVRQVKPESAREIVAEPSSLDTLGERIVTDLRDSITELVVKTGVAAVAGSLLLGLLVFRRARPTVWAGAMSLVLLAGVGVTTAATWNPRAISEPRYSGLLVNAPSVVGDAESILANFELYEAQLAKIVTNVSRLYDTTSTLPVYDPGADGTIALLHVSDLHLNPAAWEIIKSVSRQFSVDLVVDSGDISDHGTPAENWYLQPIRELGVPYVFVRGNHDSAATQKGVEAISNAVVLDRQVAEVAGLRIYGAGDPRFTPDKRTRDNPSPPSIELFGDAVFQDTANMAIPPDLAVVHDPVAGEALDGTTPLVLSGHLHVRNSWNLPQGTRMFRMGSTGGSGLRALEREEPTPIQLSVLYFDRASHRLQAWDDITVGGLGLTSAEIQRHVAHGQVRAKFEERSEPPARPTNAGARLGGPRR